MHNYTHVHCELIFRLQDFNLEEADKPEYFTVKMVHMYMYMYTATLVSLLYMSLSLYMYTD